MKTQVSKAGRIVGRKIVFDGQILRAHRVGEGTASVGFEDGRPEMFAFSVLAEVDAIAGDEEAAVVESDANVVLISAGYGGVDVGRAFVSDADGVTSEEAESSILDTLVELKCDSGGDRHGWELSL